MPCLGLGGGLGVWRTALRDSKDRSFVLYRANGVHMDEPVCHGSFISAGEPDSGRRAVLGLRRNGPAEPSTRISALVSYPKLSDLLGQSE